MDEMLTFWKFKWRKLIDGDEKAATKKKLKPPVIEAHSLKEQDDKTIIRRRKTSI